MTQELDQLPPHSLDAEVALIGSLWGSGGDPGIFAAVKEIVTPSSFYSADNQIIFRAMVEMVEHGKPVDGVLLANELRRRGQFEDVGGVAYLGQIADSVPSSAHWEHYAKLVREKANWRAGMAAVERFLKTARAPTKDDRSEESLTTLMNDVQKIVESGSSTQIQRLGDVVLEVTDRLGKPEADGVRYATGFPTLDAYIGGLRRGGKTIIGGKPGMGKSAIEKAIILKLAGRGIPCGVISIEETAEKIAENALSAQSGIYNNRIAFNNLGREELEQVFIAGSTLDALPVYIVDCLRKLHEIEAAAHLLVAKHKVKVIFVDHLHIIDGGLDENRNAELTRISAALKFLWKKLDVAGVELAQLNRAGGSEKPSKHNLRDSGSLEQDADVILLLHREDYYREDHHLDNNVLEVIVAKNKDSAEATVRLHYERERYLIRELNPEEFAEDVP